MAEEEDAGSVDEGKEMECKGGRREEGLGGGEEPNAGEREGDRDLGRGFRLRGGEDEKSRLASETVVAVGDPGGVVVRTGEGLVIGPISVGLGGSEEEGGGGGIVGGGFGGGGGAIPEGGVGTEVGRVGRGGETG
jgi:hypothetical protein